ncbi:MAG: hypothetical protein GF398_00795 [Chitinivibrionales bacterium]|nr:hypothetical protein [Chitinivibrionales bacterium]
MIETLFAAAVSVIIVLALLLFSRKSIGKRRTCGGGGECTCSGAADACTHKSHSHDNTAQSPDAKST